jgi:DNA polymerase-3 subunit alpha
MLEDSTVTDELTIIITDTETTGLTKPIPTDVQFQPFICEIYACKMNQNFEFLDEFETFVKPPIPMPKDAEKIHHISDEMLIGAPSFAEIYHPLYDFFCGTDAVVGQNIEYDVNVIHYELMRHDLDKKFCWPKRHICTIESSYHYQNKRLNLQKLHEFLFGEGFAEGHRAKTDVMATVRCFIELCKRGDIEL